jgi:hypothetical protein
MIRSYVFKLTSSIATLVFLQLMLSLVIGFLITTDTRALITVSLFFLTIFIIARTTIDAMLSLFTGYVLTAFLMHFILGKVNGGQVAGSTVAIVFVLVAVLTALALTKLSSESTDRTRESLTLLLGIFSSGALAAYWIQGGPGSALKLLAATGEDNAAWLQGLANSTKATETVLTSGSSFGADYLTGLFHVLFRVSAGANGLFENAKILQVEYGFLFIVSTFVAIAISMHRYFGSSRVKQVPVAVTSCVVTYASVAAIAAYGHFPLLLSSVLFVLAVYLGLGAHKSRSSFVSQIHISLLVLGAGYIWYPLRPISFFIVAMIAIQIYMGKRDDMKARISWQKLLIAAIFVVPVIYFALQNLRALSQSLENLLSMIGRPGGTYSASMLIMTICAAFAIYLISSRKLSENQFTFNYILGITFAYLALISILSLVSPPSFIITYAALKLQLFFVTVTIPFLIPFLFNISSYLKPFTIRLLVGFTVVIFVIFDGSIGNFVNYPLKINRTPHIWSQSVSEAIQENPSKTVICVNNSADPNLNYEAYLCSRMALGLVGNTNNSHNFLGGANLGLNTFEQVSTISIEEYRNLIIIAVQSRSLMGKDPEKYWWGAIPWSEVEVRSFS